MILILYLNVTNTIDEPTGLISGSRTGGTQIVKIMPIANAHEDTIYTAARVTGADDIVLDGTNVDKQVSRVILILCKQEVNLEFLNRSCFFLIMLHLRKNHHHLLWRLKSMFGSKLCTLYFISWFSRTLGC